MHPLGNIRKTYGVNWKAAIEQYAILAFLVVIFIFVILNVAQADLQQGPIIAIICFACTLPFFPLYYRRLKRRVPLFTIYEQGVGVTQNGEEKTWRWEELTTFVAPSQATLLGAVTLEFGYVQADFYTGSTKAFRVDRWSARPYELIQYIVMRMTQFTLAAPYIESYEQGEPLDFGILKVSQQGIIASGETVPWANIQRIEFREEDAPYLPTRMFVWLERAQRRSRLGELPHSAAYILMGVVDHVMKTRHLETAQEERLQGQPLIDNQRLRYGAGLAGVVVLYLIIDRFFPGVKQFLDSLW